VTFITCLVVTIPLAELFHRLVETPSKLLAHKFYDFITS
jgi:peptidoglycan/LPS O-acetylase OafA/YrhL